MRCICCNTNLSDFEATRKHGETGHYLDICNDCFQVIEQDCDLPTEDRNDLHTALDENDVEYVVIEDTDDNEDNIESDNRK